MSFNVFKGGKFQNFKLRCAISSYRSICVPLNQAAVNGQHDWGIGFIRAHLRDNALSQDKYVHTGEFQSTKLVKLNSHIKKRQVGLLHFI